MRLSLKRLSLIHISTVDVVNVKKYDLIQPHSAPYVFALGMTQSHFPKVGQNKSLLSDEERSRINEATDEHRRLDIVTQINSCLLYTSLHRNHTLNVS